MEWLILSFESRMIHRERFRDWPGCGSSIPSNRVIAGVPNFSDVFNLAKTLETSAANPPPSHQLRILSPVLSLRYVVLVHPSGAEPLLRAGVFGVRNLSGKKTQGAKKYDRQQQPIAIINKTSSDCSTPAVHQPIYTSQCSVAWSGWY